MVTEIKTSVLIIGGGLIGATLYAQLIKLGLDVILVDDKPLSIRLSEEFDARSLALAPSSERILNSINLWSLLKPNLTEINQIHVSAQHCFGNIILNDAIPLGHVIELQAITNAFAKILPKKNILAPAKLIELDTKNNCAVIESEQDIIKITAKLIVAADGSQSTVRKLCGMSVKIKDFNQHAIVANLGLQRSHKFVAYERFFLKMAL